MLFLIKLCSLGILLILFFPDKKHNDHSMYNHSKKNDLLSKNVPTKYMSKSSTLLSSMGGGGDI